MITVVSGVYPAGYTEYGRRCLQSFRDHWPSVPLVLYVEDGGAEPAEDLGDRVRLRSVWDCNGPREFLDRHKDDPTRTGRKPCDQWHEKFRNKRPYCYRYDAVKFAKQCFYPEHAAASLADGDIMIWLDADVPTFKPVDLTTIEQMMGAADLIYLGRGKAHSEIGFWAVRLNPLTREFLALLAEIYRSDAVFKLDEWHSAFVFDHCRRRFTMSRGKARDLTPNGSGHVWFQSPLGAFCDHLKGNRKQMDASPERPQ